MYYLVLCLSLALHIGIYFALKMGGNLNYKEANLEEIITHIGKQNDRSKQIILYAEAPEIDVTNQEKTNLLSKKNQRVKKQTIAKKIGKTANRKPLAKLKMRKTEKQNKSRDGLEQAAKPKDIDINRLASLYEKSGVSTIGEKIFDQLEIGNFTALNTDKYSFYSFTERVNERIRSRWVERIEASLIAFKRRGLLGKIKSGESRTVIEVLLDKEGYYKGTRVFKSSGLKAWDEAAIAAFQTGAPFLNPPKEIVEDDGMIRLQYSFSVMWHPSYARQIR